MGLGGSNIHILHNRLAYRLFLLVTQEEGKIVTSKTEGLFRSAGDHKSDISTSSISLRNQQRVKEIILMDAADIPVLIPVKHIELYKAFNLFFLGIEIYSPFQLLSDSLLYDRVFIYSLLIRQTILDARGIRYTLVLKFTRRREYLLGSLLIFHAGDNSDNLLIFGRVIKHCRIFVQFTDFPGIIMKEELQFLIVHLILADSNCCVYLFHGGLWIRDYSSSLMSCAFIWSVVRPR